MFYQIAADSIVFIHFLWILFLIFGAFIGRRYRTVRIFHLAGLGFAVIIQIFGWYCPLTHLELWLRQKHNPLLSYRGSFIIHYVEKIVYIELSRVVVFVLTLVLAAATGYWYLRRKKR